MGKTIFSFILGATLVAIWFMTFTIDVLHPIHSPFMIFPIFLTLFACICVAVLVIKNWDR